MTHTPGPWQWTSDHHPIDIATFDSGAFYNNPELRGPNDESIITCDEYKVHNKIEDARLIAAAPELLEALQEIQKLYLCPAPKTMKDWSARVDVMADFARKAIAKAEGKVEKSKPEIEFINYYECQCGEGWTDVWSCACNDACPNCGRKDIEPYHSVERIKY